jgi:hypothetical protein
MHAGALLTPGLMAPRDSGTGGQIDIDTTRREDQGASYACAWRICMGLRFDLGDARFSPIR